MYPWSIIYGQFIIILCKPDSGAIIIRKIGRDFDTKVVVDCLGSVRVDTYLVHVQGSLDDAPFGMSDPSAFRVRSSIIPRWWVVCDR